MSWTRLGSATPGTEPMRAGSRGGHLYQPARAGELCPSSNSSTNGAADHECTTMTKVLLAAFGAALFGLACGVSPTSATPVGPTQVAVPDSGIEQARTVRRKNVKRRAVRRGGVARSSTGTNVS